MKGRWCRVFLAACVLLAGCAPLAPRAPEVAEQLAPAPAEFLMRGRLAVSDGTRAANVALEWRRHGASDRLEFLSPLGQVLGRLSIASQGITLEGQDGRVYRGASAEDLLRTHLGFSVPVDALGHWLLGRAPEGRVLERDAAGLPARLTDRGWLIEYPEYQPTERGPLPRRIEGHWGDLRFTLIVDAWELT